MSALATLGHVLPIGFEMKGVHINTFELGPIKGRLRRDMMDAPSRFKQVIAALKHAVPKLGPFDAPEADLFRRLPMPDVDYINFVLSARAAASTKTGMLTWTAKCVDADEIEDDDTDVVIPATEGCGTKIEVNLQPQAVQLLPEKGVVLFDTKGRPYQECTFQMTDGHTCVMKMRIPTLGDMERMDEQLLQLRKASRDGAGLGKFTFQQLEQLMLDFDGKNRGLTVDEFCDMDCNDFDAMNMATKQVRPQQLDSDIVVQCSGCFQDRHISAKWDAWQDPFAARRHSGN